MMGRLLRQLLCLVLACAALAAHAKLFLWEAERDGQKVWLLGSVHVGRADLYPLAAPIEAAYRNAGTLAVEADITDTAAVAALVPMTALPPGQTIPKLLTAKQNKQLDATLQRLGLSHGIADHLKPWFLAITLSALEMRKQGFDADAGIDLHYLTAAKAEGKQVVELESAKSQFDLLDSLPQADGVALLASSLGPNAEHDFKREFDRMIAAWKAGDAARMRHIIDEDSGQDAASRRVNDKLFTERNRTMAEKIATLASTPAPLVVIGAGHLAGPDSVIDLLRARGFRVTQH